MILRKGKKYGTAMQNLIILRQKGNGLAKFRTIRIFTTSLSDLTVALSASSVSKGWSNSGRAYRSSKRCCNDNSKYQENKIWENSIFFPFSDLADFFLGRTKSASDWSKSCNRSHWRSWSCATTKRNSGHKGTRLPRPRIRMRLRIPTLRREETSAIPVRM